MSNTQDHNDNMLILVNRETDEICENERIPRLITPNIGGYFRNSNNIREENVGYIDSIKSRSNVRILSINPHRFRLYD